MPGWSPLQFGLAVGIICGVLWSLRVVMKNREIAGVFMLAEGRFWRSLFTGFAISCALSSLVFSILAGLLWLLLGLALRLVGA